MAANLDQIVEQLSTLSVLEAADLVKKLEEKWGVSAAAPVAMAAAPGAATAAAEPVEEKTEFDVVIKETGAKKIDVIKVIRQLTNLGSRRSQDNGRNRRFQGIGGRWQGRGERSQEETRRSGRDHRSRVRIH
jgi:large subunit ribosomal protein L7/L12